MQFSQKTEYAIHGVLFLALERKVTLVEEIADTLKVSSGYLSKVMQELTQEEILKSYKGPSGGYILARSTEEITLGEIIKIFEQEEEVLSCLAEERDCEQWSECIILEEIEEAYENMLDELEELTIENIIQSEGKLKEMRRYLDV